jgi:hypothetical protein
MGGDERQAEVAAAHHAQADMGGEVGLPGKDVHRVRPVADLVMRQHCAHFLRADRVRRVEQLESRVGAAVADDVALCAKRLGGGRHGSFEYRSHRRLIFSPCRGPGHFRRLRATLLSQAATHVRLPLVASRSASHAVSGRSAPSANRCAWHRRLTLPG